ncbi:MAG TPA: response regulator [Halanaerobiales bacterium]|nr:response regulator [Halanaerobiales bacterium]
MSARVLIVDDAVFMRIILRRILENAGYEVIGEASTGDEAVEQYSCLKPDLVTMDITMPSMDGIKATEEILRLDQEAIIIMVSALGQHNMVARAMEAGAKDFIVKPFNRNNIIERLEKHIESD